RVDLWQSNVNGFLNGILDPSSRNVHWSGAALLGRIAIFTLIIANVVAVLLESIPEIDVSAGNLFDYFEAFSVIIFTAEYFFRLFSASKNALALFSPWVYATTFYGIVDVVSVAPWFVEQFLIAIGVFDTSSDFAKVFRIVR
ncbi:MAG: ion transporter, partial [bacterium]